MTNPWTPPSAVSPRPRSVRRPTVAWPATPRLRIPSSRSRRKTPRPRPQQSRMHRKPPRNPRKEGNGRRVACESGSVGGKKQTVAVPQLGWACFVVPWGDDLSSGGAKLIVAHGVGVKKGREVADVTGFHGNHPGRGPNHPWYSQNWLAVEKIAGKLHGKSMVVLSSFPSTKPLIAVRCDVMATWSAVFQQCRSRSSHSMDGNNGNTHIGGFKHVMVFPGISYISWDNDPQMTFIFHGKWNQQHSFSVVKLMLLSADMLPAPKLFVIGSTCFDEESEQSFTCGWHTLWSRVIVIKSLWTFGETIDAYCNHDPQLTGDEECNHRFCKHSPRLQNAPPFSRCACCVSLPCGGGASFHFALGWCWQCRLARCGGDLGTLGNMAGGGWHVPQSSSLVSHFDRQVFGKDCSITERWCRRFLAKMGFRKTVLECKGWSLSLFD